MNFVGIDIGASCTRYVSDNGKISYIPNNMVILDENIEVDLKPDDEGIENALEVVIRKTGESAYFPVKALIGHMAESYGINNDRPSVMTKKHTQRINYISSVVVTALSKMAYNLGDNLHVYMALPPIEVKTAKEYVKENLCGEYTVTFPKFGNKEVKFTITDVHCFEESFLAMMSYFFDMNMKLRKNAEKYMNGTVLSLDIGASTTDLAIIKNGKYMEKSGQTYNVGCNDARDLITSSVSGVHNYEMPIDDAVQAMSEGRLKMGNSFVDISDIVRDAKRTFAKTVINKMQGYFRSVEIPIQTINAIVVSGGGSMQSQYIDDAGEVITTSEPMSSYITEYLREVCPKVDVVAYGSQPRLANISGLFIRAAREKIAIDAEEQAGNVAKASATVQDVKAVEPVVVEQPASVNIEMPDVIK